MIQLYPYCFSAAWPTHGLAGSISWINQYEKVENFSMHGDGALSY
jgi:hypothetical protein